MNIKNQNLNLMKLFLKLLMLTGLFFPILTMAQVLQPELPANQIKYTITPTAGPTLSAAAFVNPAEVQGSTWNVKLSQRGGHQHTVDLEDELQAIKAIKTADKIANEIANGTYPDPSLSETETVTAVTPLVLSSFEANGFDGWSPPDNDMAISDNGYIVSVINSAVRYFDADGNPLNPDTPYENLLSGLDVSTFIFDPKVLYDPVEDKFIMVVLDGNTPETSQVVVGFSVSENPMDGWYFYTFSGDFLDGNWFDFPNIAISENDLFISGNLFSDNSGFDQTVLLQIKKEEAFTGGDVDWEYFNNVTAGNGFSAFTLVPASFGYDGEYGPGIFMVSNDFAGNEFSLYEVTDSVNADQVINVYSINTGFYDPPGEALQLGSTSVLSTGGNRIRNAYYANGFVHFVFSLDVSGGYSGVRYNRVDVASLINTWANFTQTQFDLSYPSVSPYSLDENSNEAMICFLQSGSSIYPQIGAVNVDESMTFSDPVLIKAGETPILTAGGGNQRWGDYSGGGRRHNTAYPNAWFVACYGQGNDYGNWIFEVSDQSNGLPPVADFEASPKFGEAPLATSFNDLSINGIETYAWTFEGGTPATSTDANPNVNYTSPGIFDVELIVANAFGSDTIFKNNYITASELPNADFTADVTVGTAPLTVNFENLSSNVNAVAWTFGGGSPATSNDLNPVVTYDNPGVYAVGLIVVNDFGTDQETKFEYINVGVVGVDEQADLMAELKVFPNPVQEEFQLEFVLQQKTLLDIYIVDSKGTKVKTLLYGKVKGGENILSFNKSALSPGTYFLIIQDNEKNTLQNEKIIIGQ